MNNEQEHADDSTAVAREARTSRSWREWMDVLPGQKRDYFFLSLVVADILLLVFGGVYQPVFQRIGWDIGQVLLGFDQLVVILWALYLWARSRHSADRWAFARMHWYELIGLLPLGAIARSFLLLRGAKFGIAFYKLGRADQGDVAGMITRDITFRFRDVIVDTIADAVFLQSLRRVEEVMLRLDYSRLAHAAFNEYQEELRVAVNNAVRQRSIVGKLSSLPFLNGIGDMIGDDLSEVIKEVLETEAAGKIMKDITRGILHEMTGEVHKLDVERITGMSRPAGDEGISPESPEEDNAQE